MYDFLSKPGCLRSPFPFSFPASSPLQAGSLCRRFRLPPRPCRHRRARPRPLPPGPERHAVLGTHPKVRAATPGCPPQPRGLPVAFPRPWEAGRGGSAAGVVGERGLWEWQRGSGCEDPSPCYGRGHLPQSEVAQGSIRPSLEYLI